MHIFNCSLLWFQTEQRLSTNGRLSEYFHHPISGDFGKVSNTALDMLHVYHLQMNHQKDIYHIMKTGHKFCFEKKLHCRNNFGFYTDLMQVLQEFACNICWWLFPQELTVYCWRFPGRLVGTDCKRWRCLESWKHVYHHYYVW